MAGTALPDGTQIAEWGGFKLHPYLAAWQDQFLGRIAQHTFDRRPGGANEDMGDAQRVTRVSLVFTGESELAACRDLLKLWSGNKTRLLVHPIWGRFNATFLGIEAGELRVDAGANQYTVSGQFVESNVNAETVQDGAPAVAAKASKVSAQVAAVSAIGLARASANAPITAYTTAAASFSSAALGAALSNTPDSSLPTLLASALGANDAATLAIRQSVSDSPEAASDVAACEILGALLLDLGAGYLAQRPPLVEYVPGEPTPLLAIASLWYPGDALNRLAEIRANNPDLIGVIVPTGFRLQMASS